MRAGRWPIQVTHDRILMHSQLCVREVQNRPTARLTKKPGRGMPGNTLGHAALSGVRTLTSQPRMTWPSPTLHVKASWPASWVLQNFLFPSVR